MGAQQFDPILIDALCVGPVKDRVIAPDLCALNNYSRGQGEMKQMRITTDETERENESETWTDKREWLLSRLEILLTCSDLSTVETFSTTTLNRPLQARDHTNPGQDQTVRHATLLGPSAGVCRVARLSARQAILQLHYRVPNIHPLSIMHASSRGSKV